LAAPKTKLISFSLGASRDIDMTLSSLAFDYIRDELARRVAISLTDDKKYLVVNRLLPVLRRHRIPSLNDLVLRLKMSSDDPIWDEMVDALTTNETYFFRDDAVFRLLSQSILPSIYSQAVEQNRTMAIWSAGCSSGQEAYSVAMSLFERDRNAGDRIRITGSDVSDTMLRRAAKAWYSSLEVARGLSDVRRRMFFSEVDDGWQVNDDLKRLMRWEKFSLVDTWPRLPMFDLVLMRNVLVYFDLETREKVFLRVRHAMRPGGVLILGSAESVSNVGGSFDRVNQDGVTYCVAKLTGS
jgi:chemotaxis protein methyltransferase CheR